MQDPNNNFTNVSNNIQPHHDVDVKFLVAKILGNWYWYVLSVALFILLGVVVFFYTAPYYTIQARVLVSGYNMQGRQMVGADESTTLTELNNSYPNSVVNELEIIHSKTLLDKTMRALQINVEYWAQGDIRYDEVYKRSPYFIKLLSLNDPKIIDPIEYDVRVVGNKVKFEDENYDTSFTASFGDTYKTSLGLR